MSVNTLKIKQERIKRGWTQSDLARKLGKPPTIISRVERGKYESPSILKQISELLGIEIEDLVLD